MRVDIYADLAIRLPAVCSAILNALLTLLNERLFDNGNQRLPVPLLCLVGASNELPESEELDALYDRFLIRRTVNQVGPCWTCMHACRQAGSKECTAGPTGQQVTSFCQAFWLLFVMLSVLACDRVCLCCAVVCAVVLL